MLSYESDPVAPPGFFFGQSDMQKLDNNAQTSDPLWLLMYYFLLDLRMEGAKTSFSKHELADGTLYSHHEANIFSPKINAL